MSSPLVSIDSLSKRYGDHLANDQVSLAINSGEIHALLGENGAGKSTLVKMLFGSVAPDEGQIYWQGEAVEITSPTVARGFGIAMVFQHFSLFPALNVAENIALAQPSSVSIADVRKSLKDISARWDVSLDLSCEVGSLSVGEQQRLEVIRALMVSPKLLIMDEPTSVLTPQEADRLFDLLRRLKQDGTAILYISHKLDEIMALADKVTVLRGGKVIDTLDPSASNPEKLAEMMVGKRVPSLRRNTAEKPVAAAPVMTVDCLSFTPPQGTVLTDISFNLYGGEILGIAGIAGNGQNTLLSVLSGEAQMHEKNSIRLNGAAIGHLGISERRALGIEAVPEQRLGHAAVGSMSLIENGFLTQGYGQKKTGGVVAKFASVLNHHPRQHAQFSQRIITEYDVRCHGDNPRADFLSGGNLQKFILGRSLLRTPKVAIIAQPTWGVDIGAATAIRQKLVDMARQGMAVLLISQDLDELMTLADRVAVLSGGCLTPPMASEDLTSSEIGLMMAGVSQHEAVG